MTCRKFFCMKSLFTCVYFRTLYWEKFFQSRLWVVYAVSLITVKYRILVRSTSVLDKTKNTPYTKKMQFWIQNGIGYGISQNKGKPCKESHKKRTNDLLSLLSVAAQLVFGFQDIKSCFLHLLATQLSVIRAKDKNHPQEQARLFNFPKYPARFHKYHALFITTASHLSIHIQLKKRLSMFPRDF